MTCTSCGWVHFGVKRSHAEAEVKKFNEYFATLTKKLQKEYYGGKGSSIEQYERCFSCGGSYNNMRESVAGDCPYGCTIQPIINSED